MGRGEPAQLAEKEESTMEAGKCVAKQGEREAAAAAATEEDQRLRSPSTGPAADRPRRHRRHARHGP